MHGYNLYLFCHEFVIFVHVNLIVFKCVLVEVLLVITYCILLLNILSLFLFMLFLNVGITY